MTQRMHEKKWDVWRVWCYVGVAQLNDGGGIFDKYTLAYEILYMWLTNNSKKLECSQWV